MEKENERRCIEKVQERFSMFGGVVEECESPDFIINNKIGIEHFIVEATQTANEKPHFKKLSEGRQTTFDNIKNLSPEEKLLKTNDLINKELKDNSELDFDGYSEKFIEVFNKHYSKIKCYKDTKSLSKIVFLIEIRYISMFGWKIKNDGRKQPTHYIKILPLTKKIINLIKNSSKLDYVILYFQQENNDNPTKIVLSKPAEIEKVCKRNKIIICDSFEYAYKNTNICVDLSIK